MGEHVLLCRLLRASGSSVWALGDFSGQDPRSTLDEFRAAVAASRVHYLALTGRGGATGSPAEQIARWADVAYASTRVHGWVVVDLTSAVPGGR
jgi:hypothetical protein